MDIARQMERLREMVDEGEISQRRFDREYGALARQLLGDEAYDAARKRMLRAKKDSQP